MDKEFLVISKLSEHEYTITVKETNKGMVFSLFSSNSDIWTQEFRGVLLLSITDTGNGIIFSKFKKTMNHGDFFEVSLLIGFMNQTVNPSYGLGDYNIIENKNVIKL
mgnify:CR=1 FL=1